MILGWLASSKHAVNDTRKPDINKLRYGQVSHSETKPFELIGIYAEHLELGPGNLNLS